MGKVLQFPTKDRVEWPHRFPPCVICDAVNECKDTTICDAMQAWDARNPEPQAR